MSLLLAHNYMMGAGIFGRFVVVSMGIFIGGSYTHAQSDADVALASRVHGVFQQRCYKCHGENGANKGKVGSVLDTDNLIKKRLILPGNAAGSVLVQSVLDDEMPEEGDPLTDSEKIDLQNWVKSLGNAVSARPKITLADLARDIKRDLESLPAAERDGYRYFDLTNLHNDGASAKEVESHVAALSKTVNSLSDQKAIVVPVSIGNTGALLRVKISDYGWDRRKWSSVEKADPFHTLSNEKEFRDIERQVRSESPVVRADWFVANAVKTPLYHDLLGVPAALGDLEGSRIVGGFKRPSTKFLSGFSESGVSQSNRVIHRVESGNGAFWGSDDFAPAEGNPRKDIFSHPLDYTPDGSEYIFSIPNQLIGFALYNAAGKRLDKAPQTIVSDPERADRAVENGISCFRCHAHGYISKSDQVEPFAESHADVFTPKQLAQIRQKYDGPRGLEATKSDSIKYLQVLEKTHPLNVLEDTITGGVQRYEASVSPARAAAELHISPSQLNEVLDSKVIAEFSTLGLLTNNRSVRREDFDRAYAQLAARAHRLTPTTESASFAAAANQPEADAVNNHDTKETLNLPTLIGLSTPVNDHEASYLWGMDLISDADSIKNKNDLISDRPKNVGKKFKQIVFDTETIAKMASAYGLEQYGDKANIHLETVEAKALVRASGVEALKRLVEKRLARLHQAGIYMTDTVRALVNEPELKSDRAGPAGFKGGSHAAATIFDTKALAAEVDRQIRGQAASTANLALFKNLEGKAQQVASNHLQNVLAYAIAESGAKAINPKFSELETMEPQMLAESGKLHEYLKNLLSPQSSVGQEQEQIFAGCQLTEALRSMAKEEFYISAKSRLESVIKQKKSTRLAERKELERRIFPAGEVSLRADGSGRNLHSSFASWIGSLSDLDILDEVRIREDLPSLIREIRSSQPADLVVRLDAGLSVLRKQLAAVRVKVKNSKSFDVFSASAFNKLKTEENALFEQAVETRKLLAWANEQDSYWEQRDKDGFRTKQFDRFLGRLTSVHRADDDAALVAVKKSMDGLSRETMAPLETVGTAATAIKIGDLKALASSGLRPDTLIQSLKGSIDLSLALVNSLPPAQQATAAALMLQSIQRLDVKTLNDTSNAQCAKAKSLQTSLEFLRGQRDKYKARYQGALNLNQASEKEHISP